MSKDEAPLVAGSLPRGYAGGRVNGGKSNAAGAKGPQEDHETHENHDKETRDEENKVPLPKETGNKPKGPEPTRYGDWERAGRCSDF